MKILLVEDEARLARALVRGFTEEGHAVDVCSNAQDADEQLSGLDYDVVVLDWMLPDQDGLSLLRSWRSRGVTTPVLMLTARAAVPERVAGLRAGADDYLPKPFDFDELLARLEALYRRGATVDDARALGDVSLDVKARALVGPKAQAELTPREYALALRLFEHPMEVHTRTELLQAVWGSAFAGEPNVVDVYVGYLRKKLAEVGAARCSIRTVRGVGFRLEAQEEAP